MRYSVLLLSGLLFGCAGRKATDAQAPIEMSGGSVSAERPAGPQTVIITPDDSLVGKVAMVNQGFRFVILNFPVGHLPAPEQFLTLYRGGVKVGEVKVTSQQNDDNVVADISAGDAEVGDEARKQ